MSSTPTIAIETQEAGGQSAVRQQVRGSSLLLAGQLVAKVVNCLTQILIVRYLSQAQFGALAYALSIVTLMQSITTFGLDRAITRFLPIYHEHKEYDKLFGTILMVIGTILSIGLALILLFYATAGSLGQSWIDDRQALTLLAVLVFLAPVQAVDKVLLGMFAVFASPRSIFLRKHILAPVLRLAVVLMLIVGQGSVFFLAGGYLAATALGVAIYIVILVRLLQQQGLLAHFRLREVIIPWREVLPFTIPLLTSNLVHIVMHTADVIVLQRFGTMADVAALRAVQPVAITNQLVMASFATLFMPLAARMFARKDSQGINDLYWQTAVWIAVLSFPIFLVTFALAEPVTVLAFGSRYAGSATILALLSFGCFFNAALGFNGLTLKVYGRLRYIVGINIAAAVLNLAAILILVPRYGALGAAAGTCATLVIHNIFKHIGLRLGTGVRLFQWQYMRVYVTMIVGTAAVWTVQQAFTPPLYVSLALATVVSLAVIRCNRHLLQADETFPVLARIPLLRYILGQ